MGSLAIKAQLSKLYIETGTAAADNITAATKASPCVITCTGHGIDAGSEVAIASVGGMTELNGNTYVVDPLTADTLALYKDGVAVDSSAYTTYTSGGTATAVTYTQVKDIRGVTGVGGGSSSDIEVTNLDSTAKEFLVGLKDNGEASIEYNWVAADTGQVACDTAQRNSTLKNWRFVLSDGAVLNFDGSVKSKSLGAAVDGAVQGTMTIKISGEITLIT